MTNEEAMISEEAMTNEEAIKWLDEHTLGRLGKGGLEAKIKIVKALNKQIPMKANKKGFEYFCPCCEETCVGKNHTDGHKTRKHYCFNCGQALDWSDYDK